MVEEDVIDIPPSYPVYGSAVPEAPKVHPDITPVDDIWGSYLAKWKPKEKIEKPKPVEPWKPASYQPFDFGNYLLRARGPAVDDEPEAPRKSYWWEQPKAARAPAKQLAWWDKLIAERDAPPIKEKPVDIVPGPKGGAAVVELPGPPAAYAPYKPIKTYGSFKPTYSGGSSKKGQYWWQK